MGFLERFGDCKPPNSLETRRSLSGTESSVSVVVFSLTYSSKTSPTFSLTKFLDNTENVCDGKGDRGINLLRPLRISGESDTDSVEEE